MALIRDGHRIRRLSTDVALDARGVPAFRLGCPWPFWLSLARGVLRGRMVAVRPSLASSAALPGSADSFLGHSPRILLFPNREKTFPGRRWHWLFDA